MDGYDGYILVVDDDADHRALLAEALEETGFTVEQAANGRLALDRLEEHLPSLVLLDLKMPVMSGWAVLEALQKMPRAAAIPVLIISAYGFEWEAELIGASGYISKPVDLEVLRSKVHGLVGHLHPALLH
ncbi:MAG: response regulator [Deltaproteobacteria bacterium]|nr:response regulator [Deltaproteobacteria bacterium]